MYSNEDYLLQLLTEAGLVSDRDLTHAKGTKKPSETIVESLLKGGIVSEEDVARTMAVSSGMEFVDLAGFAPAPDLKSVVPEEVAHRYRAIPLGYEHGRLQVAITDPNNFETLDALPHVLGPDIDILCTTPSAVRSLISAIYGNASEMADTTFKGMGDGVTEGDAPIIRLVQNTLMEAVKNRASDIHIEPVERDMRVRYRIDGVLHDVEHHPKKLHASIIARIKIGLDEHR
jgi:type IV pilus assembly protein PilB